MSDEVISDEKEREFWGIHKFDESPYTLGCKLCGWGPNDPIHKKEEDNE